MLAENTHLKFSLFMRHSLSMRNLNIKKRNCSSIMFLAKGKITYTFENGGFELNEGETVFLPYNSTYSYTSSDGEQLLYQMFFNIFSDNKKLQLCKNPIKSDNPKISEIMERTISNGIVPGGASTFKFTSDVYKLLSLFFDETTDKRESLQIYPALQHLEKHYSEKTSVEHLATLCGISESQLRRIFKKEIGMSPIEYKNSLRIKSACDLLEVSNHNISEISEALGFENPYIFSKFFKTHMNTSPLKYRKAIEKTN